jgi:hypothetical protein
VIAQVELGVQQFVPGAVGLVDVLTPLAVTT